MNTSTQDPRFPHQYPRRVLLAVSGLSPQIVTETIYALTQVTPQDDQTPFVPTEVHLITTRDGAQKAELSLLSEDMGWFHHLCADYQLKDIAFNRDNIHVIRDHAGCEMDDIRSQKDNRACADFISALVRQLTADPHCALHVSIAGGRKTMGFFLGYALSLYGRAQDRLSHVLVSSPFENSLDFFYPTPYSRVLKFRDDRLADSATAVVTLADIPFVSLRHGLPELLLSGQASFNETVQAAQRSLAPPSLRISLRDRTLRAGTTLVKLPPADLALFAVFARRAMTGLPPISAPSKSFTSSSGEGDLQWAQWYLQEYKKIIGTAGDDDSVKTALKNGMDGEYFSERKSRIRSRLKKALGPAHEAYQIQDDGKRPGQFGLGLSPDAISFD